MDHSLEFASVFADHQHVLRTHIQKRPASRDVLLASLLAKQEGFMGMEIEMEKLEYRGLISNWAVVNRLHDDSGFALLLSHFLSQFLGPYLVTILKDDVLSNTVMEPVRVSTWGWIIRSLWLPSLVAFERTAIEQGREIELIDDKGRLAIIFGNQSGKRYGVELISTQQTNSELNKR